MNSELFRTFVPEMNKFSMKLTKKTFLMGFTGMVLVLAGIRWTFPSVAESQKTACAGDSIAPTEESPIAVAVSPQKPHRINSVPSYKEAFPDTNSVQLSAARKWGVDPVIDRDDAESRKRELV